MDIHGVFSQVSLEVWAVFWPCAVCYGILVPCFLLYLYMRQHVFLRYCRAPLKISHGTKDEDHLEVGLEEPC